METMDPFVFCCHLVSHDEKPVMEQSEGQYQVKEESATNEHSDLPSRPVSPLKGFPVQFYDLLLQSERC